MRQRFGSSCQRFYLGTNFKVCVNSFSIDTEVGFVQLLFHHFQNLDHHHQACFMFEPLPQHSFPWPRSLFFPCLFPINPLSDFLRHELLQIVQNGFHMTVREHLNVSFCEIRIPHLEFQFSWNPCLSPPRGQRRWPRKGLILRRSIQVLLKAKAPRSAQFPSCRHVKRDAT